MRAVIEPGVFVSALIRPQGRTGAVLQALKDKRFTLIYSTDILVEIIDVLGRDNFRSKYHISPDGIAALIDFNSPARGVGHPLPKGDRLP